MSSPAACCEREDSGTYMEEAEVPYDDLFMEEDWADIQLDSEHPVARGVQNTKLFRNIEFCVFPRACCLDNGFIKPSACCSFLVGLIKSCGGTIVPMHTADRAMYYLFPADARGKTSMLGAALLASKTATAITDQWIVDSIAKGYRVPTEEYLFLTDKRTSTEVPAHLSVSPSLLTPATTPALDTAATLPALDDHLQSPVLPGFPGLHITDKVPDNVADRVEGVKEEDGGKLGLVTGAPRDDETPTPAMPSPSESMDMDIVSEIEGAEKPKAAVVPVAVPAATPVVAPGVRPVFAPAVAPAAASPIVVHDSSSDESDEVPLAARRRLRRRTCRATRAGTLLSPAEDDTEACEATLVAPPPLVAPPLPCPLPEATRAESLEAPEPISPLATVSNSMTRGCGNKAKLTGTVGQPNRWKTLAVASEPKRAQPESTPVPMPESISPLVMSPTAMSPKTDADFPYSAPLSPVLVTSQIPNSNKYGPPSENFQPRDRGTLCVSNLPKIGRKAPCDADSVSVGVSAAQVQVQRPPPMAMNNNDGLPPLRLNDVVKDTNNGPRAPIKENLDMRKHCVFDFTSLVPAPLPAPVPGPVPGPPPGPPVVLSTYDPSRDPRKDAQAKRPAPPPLQRRSTSPSRLPKGPPPAPLPTVPHPLTRTARNTIFETCPSQDIVTFMADRGKRPNPTPAAESNKRPRPEDRYVPTDRYRPEPHDSRDYDRDRDRDRDRRDNRFCSDGRWNDDRRGNSWHQTDRRRWSTDGRGSGNRR